MLINIDNGGTLTDFCVIDGATVHRTKTLTTPQDLSQCLIDGLRKISGLVYEEEDLERLVTSADHIRYSTTQGTNALVERKGPRLGLLRNPLLSLADPDGPRPDALFKDLVGTRVRTLDPDGARLEIEAVQAVNDLTARGANRIVVAFDGPDFVARERQLKSILLRAFPSHLLGAVPVLYASELANDQDPVRRAYTALFNAFLHPAMEQFLYAAERKLRALSSRNPLLIFRNDGHSARVAKTTAIRTYSSGPRGGMEGARALARHYGLGRLLTMDVGGTTTDIGLIENDSIQSVSHGSIEGHDVSFALGKVVSLGAGGSSIIRVENGRLLVGPDSVGSAPGPACFGLGGRQATVTDALLILGVLDPQTFFGGDLKLDEARARSAVESQVAAPLGVDVDSAARMIRDAWVGKIAAGLRAYTTIDADLALAAFGGGGPLLATAIADQLGIRTVIVPGLAPVFSAFGIGFSNIAHRYSLPLDRAALAESLAAAVGTLTERARRDMFAEGFALDECELAWALVTETDGQRSEIALAGPHLPEGGVAATGPCRIALTASKAIPQASFPDAPTASPTPAATAAARRCAMDGEPAELPLWSAAHQSPGATGQGPGIYEESFSTIWIGRGWRFDIQPGGDLIMTRGPRED